MSESATARVPYHIQSKNTLSYIISTPQDKVDQEVDTKPGSDSVPPNAVRMPSTTTNSSLTLTLGQILTLNPPIRGPVTLNVHIQGASSLFVTLKVSLHLHKIISTVDLLTLGLG